MRKATVGPRLVSGRDHRRPGPPGRQFGRHVPLSVAGRPVRRRKALFARFRSPGPATASERASPRRPRHEHRRLPAAPRRHAQEPGTAERKALVRAAGPRRPAAGKCRQRPQVPRSEDGVSAPRRRHQRHVQDAASSSFPISRRTRTRNGRARCGTSESTCSTSRPWSFPSTTN